MTFAFIWQIIISQLIARPKFSASAVSNSAQKSGEFLKVTIHGAKSCSRVHYFYLQKKPQTKSWNLAKLGWDFSGGIKIRPTVWNTIQNLILRRKRSFLLIISSYWIVFWTVSNQRPGKSFSRSSAANISQGKGVKARTVPGVFLHVFHTLSHQITYAEVTK